MTDLQNEISTYIQEQFEAFQLDEDVGNGPGVTLSRAVNIKKHVQILILNHGVNKMELKEQRNEDQDSNSLSLLVPILLQYIDAAVTMEVTTDNKDTINRVLQLISALSCILSHTNEDMNINLEVIQSVLDRVELFSTVLLERLRSQACNLIGYMALHLATLIRRRQRRLKKQSNEEGDYFSSLSTWEKDCLIRIETILLPRLTDKSQSVRQSAIQAVGSLLEAKNISVTEQEDNKDSDDDDNEDMENQALEGLLWSMWHDPSVANRIEAIQAVPISVETIDHIVARIRDVKEKVRVAALDVLRAKVDPRSVLNEAHYCEIIQHGLTERCQATKTASIKLICTKWMKCAKFDPVELLRLMKATTNEEECEKALKVVLKTARSGDQSAIQELSDPEIRSFLSNVDKSMVQLKDSSVVFDEYQLFYTRVALADAKESPDLSYTQKEDILVKTAPDIPTLCDLFQKHLSRFVESIDEEDEESEEQECFVCLQLLQLAKIAGLQEEGSRRHFASVMTKVLADCETPDDIVEECVESLRAANDDNEYEFFNAISLVLAGLMSSTAEGEEFVLDEEKEMERNLRVLFIFSVVLENAPSSLSSHDLLDSMVKIILSAVNNPNKPIREIGISCFGKLGLFSDEKTVLNEFKPILFKIVTNEGEALQCRGQALLALSDWALLYAKIVTPSENKNQTAESLTELAQAMIQHTNISVASIAAEVAAKLLFSGHVQDRQLMGQLLAVYLDPNNKQNELEDQDLDSDVKEVGSPLRLQQLLSLFFPAFCLKSEACRQFLLNSIKSSLEMAMGLPKKKSKNSRSRVFPLTKMVEYVISIVSESKAVSKEAIPSEEGNDVVQENNEHVELSAAVQVAQFLVKYEDKLTVTQRRSLCKYVGGQDVAVHETSLVLKLKGCMESLSFISDSTSLKSLQPLMEVLQDVNGDVEQEGSESEDDKVDEEAPPASSDEDTVTEEEEEQEQEESSDDSTIEDVLMESLATLTVNTKENPPRKVSLRKSGSKNSRSSSTLSNVSVLESLGSPNP